jgi:2-keto-4-pentenoate hydratase/2-oxohepta-3-ene-1,7-dioic acid hydratase in catechol pathway
MKLVSFHGLNGEVGTGAVHDDRVIDLSKAIASLQLPAERAEQLTRRGLAVPQSGIMRLLYAGEHALRDLTGSVDALIRAGAARRSPLISETPLLAPVPRPGKIVAIGRNYADHAKETGVDPFEKPRIIAKLASSVVGPGAVISRPASVAKLDFEAELAVVIGAFASNVSPDKALNMIAGYTALNDLSAREFQFDVSPPQTTFAKSMDGFCPMGPWLVTKDEVGDAQQLEVSSYVNDERMQFASTSDMLFPVARLVEYVSQFMTLEPGDVIATGTPAGIGAFRMPPIWLKPGDRVRIEISRIGVLEHSIG